VRATASGWGVGVYGPKARRYLDQSSTYGAWKWGNAFALSAWVRLHGVVALEVFGHLRPAVGDGGPLFEQEIGAILRQAGLTPRRAPPARS
jgi:hypothetical protein